MPQKKTRQHYVPQFYLKYFAIGNSDNVFCYDKINKKSFQTNSRDICCEINFYSPKQAEESLEKVFSECESYWNFLFKKVIESEDLSILNTEEFAGLLIFLVLQKQRTMKRRKLVSSARKFQISKINEKFTDWKIVPSTDLERIDHLLSMIELYTEDMNNVFKNNWELIINNSQVPFFTSDDPLIQQLVKNAKRFRNSYVKNYFPITPKLLIVSEPLTSQGVYITKESISDKNTITKFNQLTFNNAFRFIILNNNFTDFVRDIDQLNL